MNGQTQTTWIEILRVKNSKLLCNINIIMIKNILIEILEGSKDSAESYEVFLAEQDLKLFAIS